MQTYNAKITNILATMTDADYRNAGTPHESLGNALMGANLNSGNGGWYNPKAIKIEGLSGVYMVNKDGNINCEYRFIEVSNGWQIQELTLKAFERLEAAM